MTSQNRALSSLSESVWRLGWNDQYGLIYHQMCLLQQEVTRCKDLRVLNGHQKRAAAAFQLWWLYVWLFRKYDGCLAAEHRVKVGLMQLAWILEAHSELKVSQFGQQPLTQQ